MIFLCSESAIDALSLLLECREIDSTPREKSIREILKELHYRSGLIEDIVSLEESGYDVQHFTENKYNMRVAQRLVELMKDGVDISNLKNPRFTSRQIDVLSMCVKQGFDISYFADPSHSTDVLCAIYDKLVQGKDTVMMLKYYKVLTSCLTNTKSIRFFNEDDYVYVLRFIGTESMAEYGDFIDGRYYTYADCSKYKDAHKTYCGLHDVYGPVYCFAYVNHDVVAPDTVDSILRGVRLDNFYCWYKFNHFSSELYAMLLKVPRDIILYTDWVDYADSMLEEKIYPSLDTYKSVNSLCSSLGKWHMNSIEVLIPYVDRKFVERIWKVGLENDCNAIEVPVSEVFTDRTE